MRIPVIRGIIKRRLDGLLLRTSGWRVRPLAISSVEPSFFSDPERFPKGSVEFDHGLIMLHIPHEWHQADDLYALAPPAIDDVKHPAE